MLVRAQILSSPKHLTHYLLALFEPGNESASGTLLDAAVEIVEKYLTSGTDNSVFTELAFQNSFNNDLNAFERGPGVLWRKRGNTLKKG